ncbi:MAG: dockerin type I repeat-containing protein, partial [Gemmatimonadota bacterium]|nr:dockerin type I repeat-containing protein [Gemmatimonadota bacterium]
FLHVLTATDSTTSSVPQAEAQVTGTEVIVTISNTTITFSKGEVGCLVECSECLLPGDVNNDGVLNILDAVTIIRFALGLETPTQAQSMCADINDDGTINIQDVVACLLRMMKAGL